MSAGLQVRWAQRKDKLFITADVIDAKDITVDIVDKTIQIKGEGITKIGGARSTFDKTLNLWSEIDPAQSTWKSAGNYLQVCAVKPKSGPHWDRLLQEPSRATKNWLTCDWNLWKDEYEEEEGNMNNGRGGGAGSGAAASPDLKPIVDEDGGSDIDTLPVELQDLELKKSIA